VPKSVPTTLNTRSKLFKALLNFQSSAKKCQKLLKLLIYILPKNEFDLLPKLTETFDLVVRSYAIRSSDQTPFFRHNIARSLGERSKKTLKRLETQLIILKC
jgi:hypothetical protein